MGIYEHGSRDNKKKGTKIENGDVGIIKFIKEDSSLRQVISLKASFSVPNLNEFLAKTYQLLPGLGRAFASLLEYPSMMTALTINDLKILSSVSSNHKYGLEILTDLQESGTPFLLGSLYHVLHRLEREGLVESYWGEATPERGDHRRRYYKLTAQGALAVSEHQMSFAPHWNWSFAYSF